MLLDSNIVIYAAQPGRERTLVTHNTADFRWISNLQLLDPLA